MLLLKARHSNQLKGFIKTLITLVSCALASIIPPFHTPSKTNKVVFPPVHRAQKRPYSRHYNVTLETLF